MESKTEEEQQCDWWRVSKHGWTGRPGWCDILPNPDGGCGPLEECAGKECAKYKNED